jgi:hypothetical protein
MTRSARIIFCIFFSILVLVGVGLFFVSRPDPVVQSYNSQRNVCKFGYAIELNPLQSQDNNCAVLQDDWLQLSVKSSLNVSLYVSLVKLSGGKITVFNETSMDLNASFPLVSSGAIVGVLTNPSSNVTEVNGSLTIMTEVLANTTTLSTVEPYRTAGEVLIGVGAFALFLVVWNPSLSSTSAQLPVSRKSEYPA